MNKSDIQIDLLKYHPETISRLVEIWHEGIGKTWLPDICIDRVKNKLNDHLNKDTLPITLIALDQQKPIGMCSLRENDGIFPDYIYQNLTPENISTIAWLGSLVVDPAYQKRGIGKILIEATQQKAKELNIKKLYLFAFDPTIPDYYAHLGWKHTGSDVFLEHPVTVMEIEI